MTTGTPYHIVVVEGYDGLVEPPATDEPAARAGARGIGLPLEELADRLRASVTVLSWDPWLELERRGRLFTTWMPFPATRAADAPAPAPPLPRASDRVRVQAIATTDPADGRNLGFRKPSLRGFGILADNDPLVFLGYRLARELETLHRHAPIHLVIAPARGGLACLAQLERATGVSGAPDVPTAVVVTDSSARRQAANQEGFWSREAASRRQMEDLSVALADATLTFGPRGVSLAERGRLTTAAPPLVVPRRVDEAVLDAIERVARPRERIGATPSLFLHGSMEPAGGALVVLDAVTRLAREGAEAPATPVACTGPDATFAPMAPRTFREYWSSRAFVRELEEDGWWSWADHRPEADAHPILRLCVAPFAHLPDAWSELARGSMLLLSPAETEGLAPGDSIPDVFLLGGEPDAQNVSAALERILRADPLELERSRARMCATVATFHRCGAQNGALDRAAEALGALCEGRVSPQPLGRVARMFLDRRRTLREIDAELPSSAPAAVGRAAWPRTAQDVEEDDASTVEHREPATGTLSVVVPCHGMGALVRETVESIWRSECMPDELIVVDDGSRDADTLAVLRALEADARRRQRPLTVLRQGNRGLAGARNAGLAAARGDFISFVDGDDLIEPEFFRLALRLLRHNPRLGGVAAWSIIFSGDEVSGHWNAPQPELPLHFVENCVFVPLMMRTALLRAIGGVDERQRYNYEDWEMSCRLLVEGWPIVTIPAYLQRYRVRDDSLYRTMTPVQNQVMREAMLERHRASLEPFSVEVAMMVKNRLARQLHDGGDRGGRGGRGRLVRAMVDPSNWHRAGEATIALARRWIRDTFTGRRPAVRP